MLTVIKLKSPNKIITLFNVQTKRRGLDFLTDEFELTVGVGVVSTLLFFRFFRFVIGLSTSTEGFASSITV